MRLSFEKIKLITNAANFLNSKTMPKSAFVPSPPATTDNSNTKIRRTKKVVIKNL